MSDAAGKVLGGFRVEADEHVANCVSGTAEELGLLLGQVALIAGQLFLVDGRAARRYGPMEQALGHGRDQVERDAPGPGAVAGYGDRAGIAAESGDVLLDPAQCLHLVLEAEIAREKGVAGAHEALW